MATFCAAEKELSSIERHLDRIISALQTPSETLQESIQEVINARDRLEAHAVVHDRVVEFSEQLRVPNDLDNSIRNDNPHSQEFKTAISALSTKIEFVTLHASADSPACTEIQPALERLKNIALQRIQERLSKSLQLLKDPSSNFEILRSTLLYNQQDLIHFAKNYGEQMVETFSVEYVKLASQAVISEMKSYCELLSSSRLRTLGQQPSFDNSSSIWIKPDVFSSIFSESLLGTAGKVVPDSQDEEAVTEFTRERCERAMQRVLLSAWSKADLLLDKHSRDTDLDALFHHSTSYYIDVVKRERTFLEQIFADRGPTMRDDVLRDSCAPVLSLVEEEIENAKKHPSGPAALLLTMFTSRSHRKQVSTSAAIDVVDARISYLVQVDKLLQTAFLHEFDNRLRALQDLSNGLIEDGRLHESALVLKQSLFVADILLVMATGDAHVGAADIVHMVHHRLHSFFSRLSSALEPIQDGENQVIQQRGQLIALASLLTVLDKADERKECRPCHKSLRAPLQDVYDLKLLEYADLVASKASRELEPLNSRDDFRSLEDMKQKLDAFRANWEYRLSVIAGDFHFLFASGVSKKYVCEARSTAFKVLVARNEQVSAQVKKKWPEHQHLVVSRTALQDAFSRIE